MIPFMEQVMLMLVNISTDAWSHDLHSFNFNLQSSSTTIHWQKILWKDQDWSSETRAWSCRDTVGSGICLNAPCAQTVFIKYLPPVVEDQPSLQESTQRHFETSSQDRMTRGSLLGKQCRNWKHVLKLGEWTGSSIYYEAGVIGLLIRCTRFDTATFQKRNWLPCGVTPGCVYFPAESATFHKTGKWISQDRQENLHFSCLVPKALIVFLFFFNDLFLCGHQSGVSPVGFVRWMSWWTRLCPWAF